MVIILVALTFAVVVGISILLSRRQRHEMKLSFSPTARTATVSDFEHARRLFHPGHCWAIISGEKKATIGVDSFVPLVLGRAERVELPAVDSTVRQGEPIATVHRKSKSLALAAPLSGKVSGINQALMTKPELLNDFPYSDGWMLEITPQNLSREINNLIKGITSNLWREAIRTQLVQWFSPRLGPVLQDGGQFVENFSDTLSHEEWEQLIKEFFPAVSVHPDNTVQL